MEVPEVVEWGNAMGDAGPKTSCQHGAVECTVMLFYACSKYKYAPDALTHLKFIECFDDTLINTFPSGLPPGTVNATFGEAVLKKCADAQHIDYESLSTCATSTEGQGLFAKEKAKTPDHYAVPFVTLDNGPLLYNNGSLNLPVAVCQAYKGTKPAACSEFLSQESPFAYTNLMSMA